LSYKYKTIGQLQEEHNEWSLYNFGKASEDNAGLDRGFYGIVEEVGEMSHALLKERQNIRTNENHREDVEDALGDIFIYMLAYCNDNNLDLEQIVHETWDRVSKRDWKKNTVDGTVIENCEAFKITQPESNSYHYTPDASNLFSEPSLSIFKNAGNVKIIYNHYMGNEYK